MQLPKRILLVDDDLDHLLVCNLILKRKGYEVLTLAGCDEMEELIGAVEQFHPDLIFMDHDMKGICGMDLTRMLKSHPDHSRIPIIYFTANDNILQLAKDAGADGYFSKPFDMEAFTTLAASYLS